MTPSPESYWIGNHCHAAEVILLRILKLRKIMMNRREVFFSIGGCIAASTLGAPAWARTSVISETIIAASRACRR